MRRRLASALLVLAGLGLQAGGVQALDEAIGRALFRRAWVPAPSSTRANAGLGPLYNARSCAACHGGLDRHPVDVDAAGIVRSDHLVVRLSGATGLPDPVYGHQLQTSSVSGTEPEGRVRIEDGRGAAADLSYGALAAGTRAGGRIAPALRGLGFLAEIPDEAIAARATTPDGDVGGRVNWVTGPDGTRRAGRFGWKASAATLDQQVETAFQLDLGLSTPGRPDPAGDCAPAQAACRAAPHGGRDGGPEIPGEIVSRVAGYLAAIAPDAPEAVDRRGSALFTAAGCAACHAPSLPGPRGPVQAFTDLLLHDMGPDLDGGATEPGVAATEWRTPPLWGLSRMLANGAGLLHDGRAATLADAIRLHGGAAARSRARFDALTLAERQRLIDFLASL